MLTVGFTWKRYEGSPNEVTMVQTCIHVRTLSEDFFNIRRFLTSKSVKSDGEPPQSCPSYKENLHPLCGASFFLFLFLRMSRASD